MKWCVWKWTSQLSITSPGPQRRFNTRLLFQPCTHLIQYSDVRSEEESSVYVWDSGAQGP